MDCRNVSDLTDWNTLIYGHNMKNGAMFGCLDHYREQEFYEAIDKLSFRFFFFDLITSAC